MLSITSVLGLAQLIFAVIAHEVSTVLVAANAMLVEIPDQRGKFVVFSRRYQSIEVNYGEPAPNVTTVRVLIDA